MSVPRWSCPSLDLEEHCRDRERSPDAARLRLLRRIALARGARTARTLRVVDGAVFALLTGGERIPIAYTPGGLS